jgi:hypothetical protein
MASRQTTPLRVPLGPLTEADVRTIVVEYLKEYCHELDREHLDTLCAIPQARNPLYLLVMLNELRTLGGNDLNRLVPARITSMPQDHPDTVSLFRWVLRRLEVFGPEAVRGWCLYLAHGRVGMASRNVQVLGDGRLLSWAWDETLWLWDDRSRACLEVVATEQVARRHPEWLQLMAKAKNPLRALKNLFVGASSRSAHLRHATLTPTFVYARTAITAAGEDLEKQAVDCLSCASGKCENSRGR